MINLIKKIVCVFLVSGAAFTCPNAYSGNLVIEPGFERGGTNWTFVDNAGPDNWDTPHMGAWSAYVNAPTHGVSGSVSQTVPTEPLHAYQVTFWIASNCWAAGDLSVSFAGVTKKWHNLPPCMQYKKYSFTATANDTSSLFMFSGSNLDGTYFIDDITISDLADGTQLDGFIGNSKFAKVTCQNTTTGEVISFSFNGSESWSCKDMGLRINSGEKYKVTIIGTAR